MAGCLKNGERVNRNVKSKYFTPKDMIAESTLPPYFSGATYIMHRDAIFEVGLELKVKSSRRFSITSV